MNRNIAGTHYEDSDGGDDMCSKNGLIKGKEQCNVVHAPIDKIGVPGRWLRHKLLDGILVGTQVLLSIEELRTPLRTKIMKMISFLGTEDFYTVLFLLIYWTLDSRLGRLFGVLMGVGFYTAGFLKTLLCLPRPESPPVTPEEKAYDWGLPSHHSLLGTILPWYIWMYVNVHQELSSAEMTSIFLVIVIWSFSVLFSRLYLGVHSPADIVSGGFVGVIVLSLWLQVDDIVDDFISQQRIEAPLQCVLLFIALLYLHPMADPGNPSFTDNCCLAGVVTGLIFGRSQRSRLLGHLSTLETLPPNTPFSTFAYIAMLRLITGALFVFGLRTLLKFIIGSSVKIVYQLLGMKCYSSSHYRKHDHPPSKHYNKSYRLPPIYIKKSDDMTDSDDDESVQSDSNDSVTPDRDEDISSYGSTSGITRQKSDVEAWNTNSKQMPWDIDIPTKCILYSILTYSAVEIAPQFFALIGL